MEDIHQEHGIGSKELAVLLDTFITIHNGVGPILFLHVIIIQLVNISLAVTLNLHLHAKRLAEMVLTLQKINGLFKVHMPFHQMYKRFKLKS